MARLPAGVRRRKDGTLEKRFTIDGKRHSIYGRTTAELDDKEETLRAKLKHGGPDPNQVTLDTYFEEWIERKKKTVKEVTPYRYRMWYRNIISPALGARRIQEIERRDIYRLQEELAARYHPNTANYIIRTLRFILNDAVIDDIILKNPTNGVKALKNTKVSAASTHHRALTEDEQRQFMQEARNNYYYDFFAILLLTGMRYGEAAALVWSDVDYEENVIHVSKSLTFNTEGQVVTGSTKTEAGRRDIPMNESIREVLAAQREKDELMLGHRRLPANSRIFYSSTGGILHNRTANRALRMVLKSLEERGQPIEYFTLHAFRDTFATRFIEQGGNPQTLKSLLGHSRLEMTMDLYSHVLPNTKQKEMDLVKIQV